MKISTMYSCQTFEADLPEPKISKGNGVQIWSTDKMQSRGRVVNISGTSSEMRRLAITLLVQAEIQEK